MTKKLFVLTMLCVLGGVQACQKTPWNDNRPEPVFSESMKKLIQRSDNDKQGWQQFEKAKKLSQTEQEELDKVLGQKGLLPFQQYFEKKKLDPNVITEGDWSLLGLLCWRDITRFDDEDESVKKIKYVLDKGADPNRKIFDWHFVKILMSPLEFVCCNGEYTDNQWQRQIHVANLLLERTQLDPLVIGLAKEEAKNPGLVALLEKAYEQQQSILKKVTSKKDALMEDEQQKKLKEVTSKKDLMKDDKN